jgi:hypothetical protein
MIDSELQLLIHFYNDEKFLFKTIMMQDTESIEDICDAISINKGWHFGRFTKSDREYYLNRRKYVEELLYGEYSKEYGYLKERIPVYFYLFPNMTKEKVKELAQKRTEYGELSPKVLMIKIRDLQDIRNITFTINDSFTSYRGKAIEAGIKLREEEKGREYLPDHNKIFPFSKITQIHKIYKDRDPYYEIQIWDYKILENIGWETLHQ